MAVVVSDEESALFIRGDIDAAVRIPKCRLGRGRKIRRRIVRFAPPDAAIVSGITHVAEKAPIRQLGNGRFEASWLGLQVAHLFPAVMRAALNKGGAESSLAVPAVAEHQPTSVRQLDILALKDESFPVEKLDG